VVDCLTCHHLSPRSAHHPCSPGWAPHWVSMVSSRSWAGALTGAGSGFVMSAGPETGRSASAMLRRSRLVPSSKLSSKLWSNLSTAKPILDVIAGTKSHAVSAVVVDFEFEGRDSGSSATPEGAVPLIETLAVAIRITAVLVVRGEVEVRIDGRIHGCHHSPIRTAFAGRTHFGMAARSCVHRR